MFEDLIKIRVADVKVAVPAGNGVEAGMVVLEEVEYPHRSLRMFIGQPEARAIHGPWSNAVPPRPSTWDLFVSTIALLDGRIERVVITDVEELRHFFAHLVLVYQGNDDVPLLVTARPSDALALALRAYGAEIYAEPHVLDVAGVLADGTTWVRPEPDYADDENEESQDGGADKDSREDEASSESTGDTEDHEDEGADDPSVAAAGDILPLISATAAADWGAEALAASGSDRGPDPEAAPALTGQEEGVGPIGLAPDGQEGPGWRRRGGSARRQEATAPADETATPPAPADETATPPAPAPTTPPASATEPIAAAAPAEMEAKRKKIKKRKKVTKEKAAARHKAAGKKGKSGGTHVADP